MARPSSKKTTRPLNTARRRLLTFLGLGAGVFVSGLLFPPLLRKKSTHSIVNPSPRQAVFSRFSIREVGDELHFYEKEGDPREPVLVIEKDALA